MDQRHPEEHPDHGQTVVAAALQQYNDRLVSIAEGAGPEQAAFEPGGVRWTQGSDVDALPLLAVGLDIDIEALREVCHALAHDVGDEIQRMVRETGILACHVLQTAAETMWVAGCLHERERARRELEAQAEAA